MEKSKVYFIKEVSPENVVHAYEALGVELKGNVAVKLHSGEPGNQNFLRPDFMKPAVDRVGGTIVECNTAYDGQRDTTDAHRKTMQLHGWVEIADVDIMDAEGEMTIPVVGGKHLDKNYVGKTFPEYDSMLVLSHFKGHPMGGYGGALKNISIGIASSYGKKYIHGVKNTEDPKLGDIGILSSLDPVALDQACLDLVYASDDPGKGDLIKRIESRNGVHTIEAAAALGVGSREYELITL